MFFVYILYNKEIDKYYTGQTNNIFSRMRDHNKVGHGIKYTKKQVGFWELMYIEKFETRSEAMKREKEIKSKKSKVYIKNLISTSVVPVAQWIEQLPSKQ